LLKSKIHLTSANPVLSNKKRNVDIRKYLMKTAAEGIKQRKEKAFSVMSPYLSAFVSEILVRVNSLFCAGNWVFVHIFPVIPHHSYNKL